MGKCFWVAKISNIFGVPDILDIFGLNSRCWVHAYVSRKNESTPLPVCGARGLSYIQVGNHS